MLSLAATPGAELLGALAGGGSAIAAADASVTEARVGTLFADDDGLRIHGVRVGAPTAALRTRPGGTPILAWNGYGGNPAAAERYMLVIAQADYHGSTCREGRDAVVSAEAGVSPGHALF